MNKPKNGRKLVKLWTKRLAEERNAHKKYRDQAKDSEQAARDDREIKPHQFNIHWANSKIVQSAIYASRPKPDVRRRFQKPDPEEKQLAKLVERGLEYQLDTNPFDTPADAVVKDYVIAGMGVPRIVYDAKTAPVPDILEEDEESSRGLMASIAGEEAEPTFEQGLEEIAHQSLSLRQVPRKHFHWEPGHTDWGDVGWVAYESFPTRAEIKREYGITVKGGTDENDDRRTSTDYQPDEVQVFEIWNKRKREIIVIATGHQTPLDHYEDKLGIQGFYPSPRPAFANLKSDQLEPKPDYCFIRKQIASLNRLSERRDRLVAQIRAVRLYDAKLSDALQQLENGEDSANIPITNLISLLDSAEGRANFDRVLVELPMEDRIQVVHQLSIQIEAVKNEIYEVLGISDIVRGSTNANETAAAQTIKGQWANVRLNDKTKEVNRLWRDVLRMMAEIMCEHFDDQQLFLMTGIEVTPRMRQMMKSDIGRSFAIDIETDSTVLKDDQEERQQKLEMVNVLLEKLQQIIPAVQQQLLPVELLQEILLFSVSSYKHGKQLEDSIYEMIPQLENLQNVQMLQQQLMQAQQALQVQGEQAGQQIQQLQGQLAQVNERDESRKDAETQVRIREASAKTAKDEQEAEAQRIENQFVSSGMAQLLDMEEQRADIDKTHAETDKIRSEMVVNG